MPFDGDPYWFVSVKVRSHQMPLASQLMDHPSLPKYLQIQKNLSLLNPIVKYSAKSNYLKLSNATPTNFLRKNSPFILKYPNTQELKCDLSLLLLSQHI